MYLLADLHESGFNSGQQQLLCLPFIATAAVWTVASRAPQTPGEVQKKLAKRISVMSNWPQLLVPFCISSQSRICHHSQNSCHHLSCKCYMSVCQRLKRQWHLEPQCTHRSPIMQWDHVQNVQVFISNSFIQGNKMSRQSATMLV